MLLHMHLQVGRTFSSCGGTVAATHEVLGGGRSRPQTFRLIHMLIHARLQVGRTFSSCGGTVAATHEVLGGGRALAGNIAGGTHHAFRARWVALCATSECMLC